MGIAGLMFEQVRLRKSAARQVLDSIVNMALRGLTLVSKFFLLVFLAKALAPEQFGVYGLFTASISYALYLLGLDFYAYAQREMLSLPRTAWCGIIYNQFMFYGAVYFIVLPLLLLVFVSGLLPWQIIGWFYLVLALEHLSQELSRLLVVCEKVTLANVALFFRGGAWVYAIVVLFRLKPELHGLTPIWAGWSVGVAISIAIGIYGVLTVIGSRPAKCTADWRWVIRGLKVAAQFLLGTLALRGLFTFDRYFLDLYVGKSAVGVYSFFMSIANSMQSFTDAGVLSRLYPRIVATYRTGQYDDYRRYLKKMAFGIILLFVGFSFGLYLTIQPMLYYIGRQVYAEQASILWILLASMGFYCLGMVPHYALYAQSADQPIVISHLLSVLLFITASIFLTPTCETVGMALSVLVGTISLGIIKLIFSLRKEFRSIQ